MKAVVTPLESLSPAAKAEIAREQIGALSQQKRAYLKWAENQAFIPSQRDDFRDQASKLDVEIERFRVWGGLAR